MILADSDIRKQLVKAFGTTGATVSTALSGKSRSPLANRIRKRALDLGAQVKGREKVKML